jgi:hypothetical protein
MHLQRSLITSSSHGTLISALRQPRSSSAAVPFFREWQENEKDNRYHQEHGTRQKGPGTIQVIQESKNAKPIFT